jgi:uncharacterized membrane protein
VTLSPRTRPVELPRRDWLLAGVAGVAVLVAGYLTVTKLLGGSALFCETVGGCQIVQASRYALFLGLPTAAWGLGLYAVVAALAVAGLGPRRWLLAFLLATTAVAFSAYLTYLELVVIGAVCGYCVVSAALASAVFALLLARRAAAGRWRWLRPTRVTALATGVAALTIAVGVAGHHVGSGGPAHAYREALARHLSATDAIMYGAFW